MDRSITNAQRPARSLHATVHNQTRRTFCVLRMCALCLFACQPELETQLVSVRPAAPNFARPGEPSRTPSLTEPRDASLRANGGQIWVQSRRLTVGLHDRASG